MGWWLQISNSFPLRVSENDDGFQAQPRWFKHTFETFLILSTVINWIPSFETGLFSLRLPRFASWSCCVILMKKFLPTHMSLSPPSKGWIASLVRSLARYDKKKSWHVTHCFLYCNWIVIKCSVNDSFQHLILDTFSILLTGRRMSTREALMMNALGTWNAELSRNFVDVTLTTLGNYVFCYMMDRLHRPSINRVASCKRKKLFIGTKLYKQFVWY